MNKKKRKKKTIYAIYRGDKFIDVGTINELSKRMGKSKSFIKFLTSPTNKKRDIYYNRMVGYKLDDE